MKNNGAKSVLEKSSQSAVVSAVRTGLVNMIPILIIGAFALILKTFPLIVYQKFLSTSVGAVFLTLLDFVYGATFGVLSVYMTFSISRAYVDIKANRNTVTYGAVFAALLSFFIMAGANLESFGSESMGPKSMFLAIITGLGATALYIFFENAFSNRKHILFSGGADRTFNRMITTLLPITLVAGIFALINLVLVRISGAESVRELLSNLFNKLFSFGEVGFIKGFFFVLLSSILWFFGIHGSDTLEGVMQTYFAPGLEANQAAVAAGGEPTQILTKQFFDCFVLMGGCGSAICLLIAILLFSRNRARRGLGVAAAFPMIFNINELMVFGLPIIFNPVMLVPFLLVPLVCYSVSYVAMLSGLVPMITGSVEHEFTDDHFEDIRYLYFYGIDVEEGKSYYDYVFCVYGTMVSSYKLQLSYTTNNQFSYQIFNANESPTNSEGAVPYTTHSDTPQTYYYKATGEAIAGSFLNDQTVGGEKIANNTKHTATYGSYSNVNKYAEPLYWQTTNTQSGYLAGDFINYYILRVNVGDKAINDRETDVICIAVKSF